MDLTNAETIVALCRRYGILPKRARGQNFLVDREILDKIVAAADLKKDDTVLEIGAGFGVLTVELVKSVRRVVAVETDRQLVKALSKALVGYKNVEIILKDILELQVTSFKFQEYGYKIVSNLPYQITSAVLRKFLENELQPSEITVMVQKEVAERICAEKGSALSLSVQFFGQPEIVAMVPRTAFWPEPEVDSAILKITKIKETTEADLEKIEAQKFFKAVKVGFSSRRKQLHNNLSGGLGTSDEKAKEILVNLGFDERVRAEDLNVDNWIKLAEKIF